MSSLKTSTTCKIKYGGNYGEIDLKQALDLLFQVKGAQYCEKNPAFIIPCSDEFLGIARAVDADLIENRKLSKKIKPGHRPLSNRSLDISAKSETPRIYDFFSFILKKRISTDDTSCEKCLAFMSIVMYAVSLWQIIQLFELTSSKQIANSALVATFIQKSILDEEKRDAFVNPIYWFCGHTMTSFVSFQAPIADFMYRFVKEYIYATLCIPSTWNHLNKADSSPMAGLVAGITAVTENIFETHRLSKALVRPIKNLLINEGFIRNDSPQKA